MAVQPKAESPLSVGAGVGGSENQTGGGPSFIPEYPGSALEVKAACIFCKFFKSIRLRRGVCVFCRLNGEKVTPDAFCGFYDERGGL